MHAKHVHRQRLALVEDAHSMALQRCALLFKNTGALQAASTRLPAVVVTGMLAFFANWVKISGQWLAPQTCRKTRAVFHLGFKAAALTYIQDGTLGLVYELGCLATVST